MKFRSVRTKLKISGVTKCKTFTKNVLDIFDLSLLIILYWQDASYEIPGFTRLSFRKKRTEHFRHNTTLTITYRGEPPSPPL
jgi:hypothetical protein